MRLSSTLALTLALSVLGANRLAAAPQGPTDPASYFAIATSTPPNQIAGHTLCALPGGGAMLFGGETANGNFYATYEWTGTEWTKQYSLLNPSGRVGHALVLDTQRGVNLMFGGANPGGQPLGDTWRYSQGSWTILNPSGAPSARQGHAMAFDQARRRAVLFGGQNAAGNALQDTWEWTGSNWTLRSPSSSPSPRRGHMMAWDALRGRVVLFGGISGTIPLNDVWEWNGTTWTLVTPATNGWGPSPRFGGAIGYDPRSERIVIHGGEGSGGCLSDMWSWDGSDWTLHTTTGPAPSARLGHAVFYDAARNELRMFGGRCGLAFTGDTWGIDLPVYARATPYGAGCPGTRGVPALDAAAGSRPVTGQQFTVELTNLPNSLAAVAFMLAGFNKDFWAGGPLPFDLALVGMPGCALLNSSDETTTLPNIGGRASLTLSIPNSSAIYGSSIYFQGAVFDRPANTQGVVMSAGLEARIGDR